jgi:hypothetical protein
MGKAHAPNPWRGAPVPQIPAKRTAYAWKRPVRARKWKSRSLTVLGIALVVGPYFTPALFDRYVLPAAAPHLPGAKVPPPGFEAEASPLGLPPMFPSPAR